MLVTLDLCLGARRLILTLAGTAVDFVVDRLTGFVLFQCFWTFFGSEIATVSINLFLFSSKKLRGHSDIVLVGCCYLYSKGIDGLARLVQQQFELDPFTNTLFLFCGRRRDRIKGLYWEKDGFILLYKRLEQGAYQWPRSESEVKTLTPKQYRWLMEGLQIEQPKAHRPVTGLTTV